MADAKAPAKWAMSVGKRSVDAVTGVATVQADLSSEAGLEFILTLTISPTRDISLLVEGAPGAALGTFTARSTV